MERERDTVYNGECACSNRTKQRTPEEQASLINRLNRIEGQVRGIKRMLEGSAYCADILIQVSAVGAALDSFTKELLTEHVRTCVAGDIAMGKEGAIEEFVGLLGKLLK